MKKFDKDLYKQMSHENKLKYLEELSEPVPDDDLMFLVCVGLIIVFSFLVLAIGAHLWS